MTQQPFSLIPFPDPDLPDITIEGKVTRKSNLLTVHYALAGEFDEIFLPASSANPARKDELWKTTCLEFFIAVKNLPEYWEFNMSPSGDWNVFRMEAYRRIGFREEASIQRLQFDVWEDTNGLVLDAAVDLNPIIQTDQILEVGVTAIVQTRNGSETYWALLHPAPQADFHLRESFILAMAA